MTSPPVVRVAGICRLGDELVLVRIGHGAAAGEWHLPGGRVQGGELLAEAVVRAMDAQAGIEALCGPFVGWDEIVADGDHEVVMYFEAVPLDPTASLAAPDAGPTTSVPDAEPTVVERRSVPTWDVCELRLVDGLAEFLADQGVIDTVV